MRNSALRMQYNELKQIKLCVFAIALLLAKLIDLWEAVCQLFHLRQPHLVSSGFFFAFALPIIPLFVLAFTLWLIE